MKLALLTLAALALTGCLQDGGSSTATSPTGSAPSLVQDPATAINEAAGTYMSGPYSFTLAADGSFTLSTQQVVEVRLSGDPNPSFQPYTCTVVGRITGVSAVYENNITSFSITTTSSTYYKPVDNGIWTYANHGCLRMANPSTISYEQVSPTCIRILNGGEANVNLPDDNGMTYCK